MDRPVRMRLALEPMAAEHWNDVRSIYEEGLATGLATFETEAPDWPQWDGEHLAAHRFVCIIDGAVAGWAAVAPVSGRCVYGGVVEDSVYVAARSRGSGVGRALLEELVRSTEQAGIWTMECNVFPENEASLELHRSCGFRVVGRRERLGRLREVWRDVVLLERRSSVVGGAP